MSDKKDIHTINSKLNNTDSLLQQQIKILKDKHKKEIDNLKNELNDIKTLLQQQSKLFNDKSIEVDKLKEQINICNYYSPIVFQCRDHTRTYYGDEQYVWWTNTLTLEQVSKLDRKLLTRHNSYYSCEPPSNSCCFTMHIPVGKIVILFKKSIEIYLSGIHYNIYPSYGLWFGKELDKEEVIISLKNIGYNCNNIIYY
jgi:hypothetical protein